MGSGFTMEDIAKLSGVARSTVRAVLDNKAWVSEKTRRKVLEVIDRYDYQPNPIAQSLAKGVSGLIGVVIRDLTNPFNDQFLKNVESVLEGYSVVYLNTRLDHDKEANAIKTLMAYRAEGMIIAPVDPDVSLRHLWKWIDSGRPVVSLGHLPGTDASCVELEDQAIGYMLTEHLLQNGHTRICFLAGFPRVDHRALGFRTCLLDYGISSDESNIIRTHIDIRSGYEAGLAVLRREGVPRPTAFICVNDLVAAGLYKAAHAMNLRIPDDISVVGCDDIELASLLGPSLTTVNLDLVDLGERCARLLLSQIEARDRFTPETVHATPRLVVRDSVQMLGSERPRRVSATVKAAHSPS